MHNDVAEIPWGLFGKKFLAGGCVEIRVIYSCQQLHCHQRIEQALDSFVHSP